MDVKKMRQRYNWEKVYVRDYQSKTLVKNVHEIPKLKEISIYVGLSEEEMLIGAACMELISGQKVQVRVGGGVKQQLRKKLMNDFIEFVEDIEEQRTVVLEKSTLLDFRAAEREYRVLRQGVEKKCAIVIRRGAEWRSW
jgi:hypothetical protein